MINQSFLLKYAIKYLSRYDSTKKNLERILQNKIKRLKIEKFEKKKLYSEIKNIIFNLESKKLINDSNFAETKIKSLYFQGKSEFYIKNILKKKGVEANIINDLLNNFDQNDPEWKIKSALTFIRKKKLGEKDIEKDIAKMARAGFSYDIIKKTLIKK